MARTLQLNADRDALVNSLTRSFQSGHLNFLLGSGASLPAIPIAGAIEQEITQLLQANDIVGATQRTYEFVSTIQGATNKLIRSHADPDNAVTTDQYAQFLRAIETLLGERHSNLLPKKANLFTTNYDLFVESAAALLPTLTLNDGFSRTTSLHGRMTFSTKSLFNVTYNSGHLYSYRVELPSINLIKLHGSLSWKRNGADLDFLIEAVDALGPTPAHPEIVDFLARYCLVLPQPSKLVTTVLDRTYYELLRLYANELERENSVLIAFGFSFCDEHVRDITLRAMKNPTLRVIVFAYDEAAAAAFAAMFVAYRNVDVVSPPTGEIFGFRELNELILASVPRGKGLP